MNQKINRYDPDTLPLSDKTREGLSPKSIDQLKAISVMLSLQDDVYEGLFDKIFMLISNMQNMLQKHEDWLLEHEIQIKQNRIDIDKNTKDIKLLKEEVSKLAG